MSLAALLSQEILLRTYGFVIEMIGTNKTDIDCVSWTHEDAYLCQQSKWTPGRIFHTVHVVMFSCNVSTADSETKSLLQIVHPYSAPLYAGYGPRPIFDSAIQDANTGVEEGKRGFANDNGRGRTQTL